MRLRTLVPALPDDLVTILEDRGIRTDTDLLFFGTPMEIYQKLPLGTITLKELTGYIEQIIVSSAAPGVRGDELFAQELKLRKENSQEDVLCGIPQLDNIVQGFSRRKIFEISGDRGSGKTALALQVILYHLSRKKHATALWVDTTGDFSADRIQKFLLSLGLQPGTETATERLEVSQVFDIHALQDLLELLKTSLSDSTGAKQGTLRYLVIDSITPIFRPLLSSVSSQGHAVMTTFMSDLRSMAQQFNLTSLVINDTSAAVPNNSNFNFATAVRKPALGPTFTYLSDATLWITRWREPETKDGKERFDEVAAAEPGTTHIAEILRSRTTISRTRCLFSIQNGILRP